jgi:hypothetical protein
MYLDIEKVDELTAYFDRLGLLPSNARQRLLEMTADDFIFKEQLTEAESIHLHIKVRTTKDLPHDDIVKEGGEPQNSKEGYIKYAFRGGYNFIFSSIPVSEEEKLGVISFCYPHLDHIGIDIRNESEEAHDCFNKIPSLADLRQWPSRKQGGDGKKVYCCHVQVNEKYWVYPSGSVHLEFAFGKLLVNDNTAGCDLRPADPALKIPQSNSQGCCGTTSTLSGLLISNKGGSVKKNIRPAAPFES